MHEVEKSTAALYLQGIKGYITIVYSYYNKEHKCPKKGKL
jgi:hypothetical protein